MTRSTTRLHQGDCIRLAGPHAAEAEGQLYQVISVDPRSGRCWLRRWPLQPKGSPVFEMALQQALGWPHCP
jgi:hypothetical protein